MGISASKTKNALEEDRADELVKEIRADDPSVHGAVIKLTDGQTPNKVPRLCNLSLNIKDQEGSEEVTGGLKSVWNINTGGNECMRADDATEVSLSTEEGQFQSGMYSGATTESQMLEQKQKTLFKETMRADDEMHTSLCEHEGLELSSANSHQGDKFGAFIQKQDKSGALVRKGPDADGEEDDAEIRKPRLEQKQKGLVKETMRADDETHTSLSEHNGLELGSASTYQADELGVFMQKEDGHGNLVRKGPDADGEEDDEVIRKHRLEQKQKGALKETMRAYDVTHGNLSRHEGLELSRASTYQVDESGVFMQKQDGSGNLVRKGPDADGEDEEIRKHLQKGALKETMHADDMMHGNLSKQEALESSGASAYQADESEGFMQKQDGSVNLVRKDPDADGEADEEEIRKQLEHLASESGVHRDGIKNLDKESSTLSLPPAAAAAAAVEDTSKVKATENHDKQADGSEKISDFTYMNQTSDSPEAGSGPPDSSVNRMKRQISEQCSTTLSDISELDQEDDFPTVGPASLAPGASNGENSQDGLSSEATEAVMIKGSENNRNQNGTEDNEGIHTTEAATKDAFPQRPVKEPIMAHHFKEFLGMFKMRKKSKGQDSLDQEDSFQSENSVDESFDAENSAKEENDDEVKSSKCNENLLATMIGFQAQGGELQDQMGARDMSSLAAAVKAFQEHQGDSETAEDKLAAGTRAGIMGNEDQNHGIEKKNGSEDDVLHKDKGTDKNMDGYGQNTTEEQENILNGVKSFEDGLNSVNGKDNIRSNAMGSESASHAKSMKRMPSVDRGEETIVGPKPLKLKLCGNVMSVQEDNEGNQQTSSLNDEAITADQENGDSSEGGKLMRMSLSSAEDSGIGSIATGSPTETGDTDMSTESQIKKKNEASVQAEVVKTSYAVAMDCQAAPKVGIKCSDGKSGHGSSVDNKVTSKDEDAIKAISLEISEGKTMSCYAAPKVDIKCSDDLENQGKNVGPNTENQISNKDQNAIQAENLKTNEALGSECKSGPITGLKYTDSLDSDNGRISPVVSIDSETAMGDVESMASPDVSRQDSINSEADLRSFEQDESIAEMESGDLIDELGIMYDDTADCGVPKASLEMRQDDRGIMMSDDEESDDEVFTDEGISSSQDETRKGSQSKDGKTLKARKVKFRSKNITVGWKAVKLLSAECVPDSEGLEGKLQESAVKMTKLLQDAQQAHRADSPDVEGAQAKVTLQAYGLKIGDKVVVGGVKTGVLRFCGPTEFASGIWAGIELDEAAGKNDGSVGGVSYFKCSPKHGIFAPVTKISKPGILSNRGGNTPRKALNYANVDTSKVTAKVDTGLHRARSTRSGSSMPTEENLLDTGERVLVAGQRRGVIRFSGEADFAPGWWYGIELDRPVGKNDGSVNGKRYFTCKPKYGVFAPPSRIQRLSDLPDAGECLEAVAERQKRLAGGTGTGSQPALNTSSTKARPGPTRQEGNLEASKIPTTPRRSLPKSSGSAGMRRPPPLPTNTGGEFRLQEGTSVFCNNELGVIRFMGTVEFAEGIWLGVELRTSKGKNDGSVGGTRYFTCKPNHGLLVRPSKVTVRGINGAKLMGNLEATDSPDKKDMSY